MSSRSALNSRLQNCNVSPFQIVQRVPTFLARCMEVGTESPGRQGSRTKNSDDILKDSPDNALRSTAESHLSPPTLGLQVPIIPAYRP